MAEIEFFCDPQDLSHAKFEDVQDDILPLLSAKS
jgi:glycyl-tRNA synthetase (class II)